MRKFSIYGNSKSYSAEENRILESLVKAHQDVVESKDNNDSVKWQRKVDTWKRIGVEFELQSKTNRPWPALWEKYLNNRLNCVVATTQGDEEDSNKDVETTGGSCSSSSSTSITSSSALEDERIKLLEVAQDYYKSESSKNTGKWKVQLEKIRIDYERRRMESTKELLNIDRQLAELQGLANQIIYR